MEFFNSAVDTLQTIVIGLGGALCVWGGVNLLEGYGQDNPASNGTGISDADSALRGSIGIIKERQNRTQWNE